MVWGMALPKNFGEFWPDGDFAGWSRDLVGHYMKQPPEIQRALYAGYPDPVECAVSYPLYVSRKFISEEGVRHSPRAEDPPFTAILDHEAPPVFVTGKTYTALGSLIMFNDRILAVDAALKDIIERFEPGMHQFFPIEIMMPKGQVFPKVFYTLVVGQYFDSFVPEKSNAEAFYELPNSGGKLSTIPGPKSRIPDLALSGDIHGGAHLWRERRFREWLTCFSAELAAEIEKAGLRIPKLHKMMEA
jgi:hypothetical protein